MWRCGYVFLKIQISTISAHAPIGCMRRISSIKETGSIKGAVFIFCFSWNSPLALELQKSAFFFVTGACLFRQAAKFVIWGRELIKGRVWSCIREERCIWWTKRMFLRGNGHHTHIYSCASIYKCRFLRYCMYMHSLWRACAVIR